MRKDHTEYTATAVIGRPVPDIITVKIHGVPEQFVWMLKYKSDVSDAMARGAVFGFGAGFVTATIFALIGRCL